MPIKFCMTFLMLVSYNLNALINSIDVVLPCHEKDVRTLELAIEGIKINGQGVDRIIVISAKKLTNKAEWFPESLYPFTKNDIKLAIFDNNQMLADQYETQSENRIGWIYQQLLKLYAPLVIPEISSNVLVLDADTIFLRPTKFIDDQGYALFNVATEYVDSYFAHMRRLIPGLDRVYKQHSGICHHMLFQRSIIEDLFREIVKNHEIDPWRAVCACIDKQDLFACLSEYETYFNFIFSHDYKVKIRPLAWEDMGFNLQQVAMRRQRGYDYVSCHSYRS